MEQLKTADEGLRLEEDMAGDTTFKEKVREVVELLGAGVFRGEGGVTHGMVECPEGLKS